jgi:hypothetical protein
VLVLMCVPHLIQSHHDSSILIYPPSSSLSTLPIPIPPLRLHIPLILHLMHLRVDNAPTRALEVPREADEEECGQEEDQDDGFVVVEGPGHCGGAGCGQGRSENRRSSAMLIRGIDRARNGLEKVRLAAGRVVVRSRGVIGARGRWLLFCARMMLSS